ncbi:unnamed protein product, partial [Effrenium voratum]
MASRLDTLDTSMSMQSLHSKEEIEEGEGVRVYIRVRPATEREVSVASPKAVTVEGTSVLLKSDPPRSFTFDGVLGESATQQEVFETVGRSVRHARCTISNILPVVFVLGIIAAIWSTYVGFHLRRLLQLHEVSDPDLQRSGVVQTVVSQALLVMMMLCFARAVFTSPGSVPDTEVWLREESRRAKLETRSAGASAFVCHEAKQNGERRYCTKCSKYKPDRCHHCRVCNSCVLRMDHHCPWIANCVGFRNHKYFFLLVLYSAMNCWFIVVTMASTVYRAGIVEMDPEYRFALVFGMTLAVIMGTLLGCFFFFHCWLLSNASTTIEFCEKTTAAYGSRAVSYDQGLFENIRAVLGPFVCLWLLPVAPPDGDGVNFFAQSSKGDHDDTDPLLPDKAEAEAFAPEESERFSLNLIGGLELFGRLQRVRSVYVYGQTGAGKTHTMCGPVGSVQSMQFDERRGIICRMLDYVFSEIARRGKEENGTEHSCRCSFLEIYKEQITDLLEPQNTNLQVREDLQRGVYVERLSELACGNLTEAFQALWRGLQQRQVGSTHMNEQSSRSHAVFTLYVE